MVRDTIWFASALACLIRADSLHFRLSAISSATTWSRSSSPTGESCSFGRDDPAVLSARSGCVVLRRQGDRQLPATAERRMQSSAPLRRVWTRRVKQRGPQPAAVRPARQESQRQPTIADSASCRGRSLSVSAARSSPPCSGNWRNRWDPSSASRQQPLERERALRQRCPRVA